MLVKQVRKQDRGNSRCVLRTGGDRVFQAIQPKQRRGCWGARGMVLQDCPVKIYGKSFMGRYSNKVPFQSQAIFGGQKALLDRFALDDSRALDIAACTPGRA